MQQTINNSKKPVFTAVAGQVSANVWENKKMVDGAERIIKSITVVRSYKDKDGQWQNTNSYNVGDLSKLKLCINKAFEYCVLKQISSEEDY